MLAYFPEFLGAMIMIFICDGAVANATLRRSGMRGAGSLQISLAIGLSMLIPCCIVGTESGTYFNSALTLGLFIDGTLKLSQALGYIAAQFAGAFVGAVLVYVFFKDQFDATEDPGTKLGVFATGPSIPNIPRNIVCEAIITFILVLVIKNLGAVAEPAAHKYLVSAVIAGIGLALGGTTGFALNPARDWAPRIAHDMLPIKGKGSSNWGYGIVTLLGPTLGAVCAVLVFKFVIA